MARENITNFASTTLLNGIGATDTSLTVAAGTGVLFPTVSTAPTTGATGTLPYTPRPFVICIDSELMVISGVSSDTLTIQTRGYDGTNASSHAANAPVGIVINRDMLNRLWSAAADTFHPDVPPFDQYTNPGPPNGYSDEFESQSVKWTIYPLPTNLGGSDAGASLDFSQTYRSHLLFQRLTSATTTYWLYQPISLSGAVVFKWKWSHGLQIINSSTTTQLAGYMRFFVSDLANPTSALWGSNSLGLGIGFDQSSISFAPSTNTTTQLLVTPVFQAAQSLTNAYSLLGYALAKGEQYGALTSSAPDSTGNRTWTFWVGDGLTWSSVAAASMSFAPQSCGFRFEMTNTQNATIQQVGALDWFRVGTQLYGNS